MVRVWSVSVLVLAGLTVAACGGNPSPAGTTTTLVGPTPSTTVAAVTTLPTTSSSTTTSAITVRLSPTGPHRVGVRDLDWLDDGVHLTAWYPADTDASGDRPSYLPPDRIGSFGTSVARVASIGVDAVLDAPPLGGLDPLGAVIFISTGHNASEATILALELASHGYLALLVEPLVELPEATEEQAAAELARIGRVLDELESGSDSAAIGVTDPARIAIGGHSAGGSLAFEIALTDPRVRAVFDLDGAMVRAAVDTAVDVPALVVVSALGLGGHRDLFPDTFAILAETHAVVLIGIDGADHFDVLDSPTVASALGGTAASRPLGPVGPAGTTSTAEVVRRFIDGALSGQPLTAAELASGVPHATVDADYLSLD